MHGPLTSRPTQRIGAVAKLPAVLEAHGALLEPVLEGLSLTRADLRPETQLPIAVISIILDRAAALPGLSEIGLLLAEAQGPQVLGLAGEIMMSCDTLGSALGTMAAFQLSNSTAAATYLHPVGEDYALGFGVYAPELPSGHIYDTAAALGFNFVRTLTAGAVRPAELLLSRAMPARPDVYRKFFQCPVRFNESQTCMILPGRSMSFALPTANAPLRGKLLIALQEQLARQPIGFKGRVKHVLRPMLLAGKASHTEVAAHLNLHPRTLGRRLEEENATFEQLKDEVRTAVAQELLARTRIAVSDAAVALGYATPSAFVRAFRRWTGSTPTVWRKAQADPP